MSEDPPSYEPVTVPLFLLGVTFVAAGAVEGALPLIVTGMAVIVLVGIEAAVRSLAVPVFGMTAVLVLGGILWPRGFLPLLLWVPVAVAHRRANLLVPATLAALAGLVVQQVGVGLADAQLHLGVFLTAAGLVIMVAALGVRPSTEESTERVSARRATALLELAEGDLRRALPVSDPVLEAIRDRLLACRRRTSSLIEAIERDAAQISETSQTQLRSAVELSAAVEQTRVILERQLQLSTSIAEMAERVLGRAETVSGHQNAVAGSAADLTSQNERIRALLSDIQGVARKSEVLALNAALEGARAGELGAGFELVGQEMKRLNQTVVSTLTDARQLTDDLMDATGLTRHHSGEARRLAVENTGLARNIQTTTQEQVAGVQQVADAMGDIARVTERSAEENDQTMRRAEALLRAARKLRDD